MDLLFEKVRPLMIQASEQVLVGIVIAFHATVFALLTIPESISSATSLGGLVWDQLSSPSPHAPAGDLTFRLFRIWTNHVVDVEIPRFRNLAARFDGKLAVSLSSLEQRSLSLRIPLAVDRASVKLGESKTQVSMNRQDVIAIDILDASSRSSPLVRPAERKVQPAVTPCILRAPTLKEPLRSTKQGWSVPRRRTNKPKLLSILRIARFCGLEEILGLVFGVMTVGWIVVSMTSLAL